MDRRLATVPDGLESTVGSNADVYRVAGDVPADRADGCCSSLVGAMIGIGVDVVDIERFRLTLERTPSMRTRLFTDVELSYVAPHADPIPSLAARFAAREGVMKALGLGLGAFGFHEVWVDRIESGAPHLVFAGRAAELADEAGVSRWHLSLTHSDLVAVAYVVAE